MHLVGFIVKIYIPMHGPLNIIFICNLLRLQSQ